MMNAALAFPAPLAEQRKEQRFPFRLPVTWLRGRQEIPLRTDDVSFEGVFLETDELPPLRQLVRMRLLLPPFHREIHAHGIAVHALQGRVRPSGMGIQLYALDRAARNVWSDFVARVRQGELQDRRIEPVRDLAPRHDADEILFLEPEIVG